MHLWPQWQHWPPISTGYVSTTHWLKWNISAPLRYVSTMPAERICFTFVNVLTPPGPLRCISAPSQLWQSRALRHRYAGLLFLVEHNAAIQLNLADRKSSAEIRNNIRLLFKIKHSVTPARKSQKKRQTQALLLILWLGTLRVVVFNNTDR